MGVALIASAGMAKGVVAKCIANGAPHIDAEGNILEEPADLIQAMGRELGPKRILISANREVSRFTRKRSPKVSTLALPDRP